MALNRASRLWRPVVVTRSRRRSWQPRPRGRRSPCWAGCRIPGRWWRFAVPVVGLNQPTTAAAGPPSDTQHLRFRPGGRSPSGPAAAHLPPPASPAPATGRLPETPTLSARRASAPTAIPADPARQTGTPPPGADPAPAHRQTGPCQTQHRPKDQIPQPARRTAGLRSSHTPTALADSPPDASANPPTRPDPAATLTALIRRTRQNLKGLSS
jgi:hypothetical protein